MEWVDALHRIVPAPFYYAALGDGVYRVYLVESGPPIVERLDRRFEEMVTRQRLIDYAQLQVVTPVPGLRMVEIDDSTPGQLLPKTTQVLHGGGFQDGIPPIIDAPLIELRLDWVSSAYDYPIALPTSLQRLSLGGIINHPIYNSELLTDLREIEISWSNHPISLNAPRLETASLRVSSIDDTFFHRHRQLRKLSLSGHAETFDLAELPSTVVELNFEGLTIDEWQTAVLNNDSGSYPVAHWPRLERLTIDHWMMVMWKTADYPESLTHLTIIDFEIADHTAPIRAEHLPPKLIYLKLGTSAGIVSLPSTLRILRIDYPVVPLSKVRRQINRRFWILVMLLGLLLVPLAASLCRFGEYFDRKCRDEYGLNWYTLFWTGFSMLFLPSVIWVIDEIDRRWQQWRSIARLKRLDRIILRANPTNFSQQYPKELQSKISFEN